MSGDKYPIDIDLWKRRRTAPRSEQWKWSGELWDSIVHEILHGEHGTASELACPVCGKQKIYAFFVTVEVAKRPKEQGEWVFIGDRWFGCHACQTQFRDRGELPDWVRLEDVVWETEATKNEVLEEIKKLERR
jgi:hypothetical protein